MKFCAAILVLAVTGCGLIRDREPEPSTVKIAASKPDCELPAKSLLADAKRTTGPLLYGAIDCLEKQIQSAFRQLRGKQEGELSLAELKLLHRNGFFDLALESEAAWRVAEEALSFLHPEGRPALSHHVLIQFLEWGRRRVPQYLRALAIPDSEAKKERENFARSLFGEETLVALEELIGFISPKWRLSLGRARTLIELFERDVRALNQSAKNQIEAAWILKSFALPDASDQGPRADIDGKSVRQVLQMAIDVVRTAPKIQMWIARDEVLPQAIPKEFPEEVARVASVVSEYFTGNRFAVVDTRLFAWALAQFDGGDASADLAPDLVRISQRLTPDGQRREGLHPIALLGLLAEAGPIARDVTAGASAFRKCTNAWDCEISLREAMKHPVLASVALKGQIETWRLGHSGQDIPKLKRLDYPFGWRSFVGRSLGRHLVARVFSAFDRDGDGIPLRGVTEEELEEPLDLSFTFLRLIAFGQKAPSDPNKKEQSVPTFVSVKPGALYRVMGLLGDRWMSGGNGDDILDADEFFSVMQVYDEIQTVANATLWSADVTRYARLTDLDSTGNLRDWRRTIFRRKEFVQKLHSAFRRELPLSFDLMEAFPKERRESLVHALVGVSAQRPLPAHRQSYSSNVDPRETLSQYVSSDAALSPTAILIALEKLMIRCDVDEDDQLNWTEMDCAVPLLLDAGLQTVQSNLLDLDPIVYDGSRLLLSFLQMPGVPLSLAKLAMANASLRAFELGDELGKLEEWVDSTLTADWDALARLIGAPEKLSKNQASIWRQEARRRFEKCDLPPKDGKLRGKAELDCFADEAMRLVAKLAEQVAPESIAKAGLERFFEMHEAKAFRLGLKLSTQPDKDLEKLMSFVPVRTSPRKILLLLEEILRRSIPLWQMPD